MNHSSLFKSLGVQRGFGLFEIMLVLALVIGAGAITFGVFSSAQKSGEAANEIVLLSTIAANVKSVYGVRHDYSTLSTSAAIRAKVIPKTMIQGTKIYNQWGYAITLGPDPEDSSRFRIAYGKVPPENCSKFISGLAPFFDDITIATGAVVTNKVVNYPLLVRECTGGSTNVTFESR